jgi:uncharacterized protein YdeI (YjbR/CyaY-like superfamily)
VIEIHSSGQRSWAQRVPAGGQADVGTSSRSSTLSTVKSKVDAYINRSTKWPEEMTRLRAVLLGAGLAEEIKWGKPCYTHAGKNIAIFQEMNDFLSLMFFKGALLSDPKRILREQGPNSRSARRIEFTSVADVDGLADTVEAYVKEAIDVEAAGLKVKPAPEPVLVTELQDRLDRDPAFRAAFESLTAGRRREYNLYFSGAKQAKTRAARVDKYAGKILDGRGLRDP